MGSFFRGRPQRKSWATSEVKKRHYNNGNSSVTIEVTNVACRGEMVVGLIDDLIRHTIWSLNEDIEDYCSDTKYAVSIKEDTAYPCLHFTDNHEGLKTQYTVSRRLYTPYPRFIIREILKDINHGPYSKKSPIPLSLVGPVGDPGINEYVLIQLIKEQDDLIETMRDQLAEDKNTVKIKQTKISELEECLRKKDFENEHLKSKVVDCTMCQNQVQVVELKSVNKSLNSSVEELYKERALAKANLREIDELIFA
ncbi:hypothetical protein Tco_0740983 [Tanacetum coccineum]